MCLFFCNCDEDTSKGKVVLGKFRLYIHAAPIKAFKSFKCHGCKMDLSRPSLTYAYGCTVCDEKLCEVCPEEITTEPLTRLKSLCAKQPNLNHWCHGAAESNRWSTPAGKIEMGNKLSEWTWSWLEHSRIPYGDFIFHRSEGWREGSSEHTRLKSRGVKRASSPAACRNGGKEDRNRRW